jgi:DNA-binding MarR family transcriptional regulator
MKEEAKQFFKAAEKFRSCNIWSIIPWINQVDYSVLKSVETAAKNEQKVYVSSIVRNMQRPAPVISRALKSLESEGWIVREVDVADRRNTIVKLTDEGEELLGRVDERMREFAGEVFREYGEEELGELTSKILGLYEVVKRVTERKRNEYKEESSTDETHC